MLDQIILITALEKCCPGEPNSGCEKPWNRGQRQDQARGVVGRGSPTRCCFVRCMETEDKVFLTDKGRSRGTTEGQFLTKELVGGNSKIQNKGAERSSSRDGMV